jgi:hypothetical protein
MPRFTSPSDPETSGARPARAADRLLTADGDQAANRSNLNQALKELIVAALLFRCGDRDGRAEAVLNQYARDVHGHFARFARQVLEGGAANGAA